MKEVTIDNKIMGYIALFEKIGRVELRECLENEDMVLFIVGERKLAELFKRNPNIITSLKEKVNKHILVAEFSRDLLTYVRNVFFRFKVKEIYINWKEGQTDILVAVEQGEIGKAIGKEGRNIKLFREAISRSFNIKSLNIKQ
ncbi:MAG: NusA-like transcription termination signal-binding factor [Candidatus Thermoplasmatota archaeon]|jgi:N utilization substance protein A|nr:NusA-like transcription termination signal-binding factor [Candidatus Thermoplasmatota archaeon]MCL5955620.1 NusA-like transcription termination signal-binding factor [Candidatus Thermoplasmatota archaeon]